MVLAKMIFYSSARNWIIRYRVYVLYVLVAICGFWTLVEIDQPYLDADAICNRIAVCWIVLSEDDQSQSDAV
jgi:hypothetical protein